MTITDGLIGIVGAVVIGSLMAAGVAVVLSPLSPIGPARHVYPIPGIAFDWTVLGLGLATLGVVFVGVPVALAVRATPDSAAQRARRTAVSAPTKAVRAAAVSGLPGACCGGDRFRVSFRGAAARRRQCVRPCSAPRWPSSSSSPPLTFGASLRTLVSKPALYGWNWSYALQPVSDPVSSAPPQLESLLRSDRDVAAWTTECNSSHRSRRTGSPLRVEKTSRLVHCPATAVRPRGTWPGPGGDRPGDACRPAQAGRRHGRSEL